MAIAFDFMRGAAVGFEAPGNGIHFILYLGIIRIMFCTTSVAQWLQNKEDMPE